MLNLYEKFFNAVKTGKSEDAASSIDKLIESDPLNPNHYIKKGDICQKNGNAGDAVSSYHKAADLMIQHGFHKKAFAVLKIILRIDPADQIATRNMENVLAEIEAAERDFSAEHGCVNRSITEDSQESSRCMLFPGLTNKETKEILDKAEIKEYADDETVIKEGEAGDSIYVLKEGKARVVSFFMGRQIELAVLHQKGDIFGEASFLTGRPRTASVIADGALVVYEISRPKLEDILELKPKITEHLNELYHVRVIETINKVKEKTV